MHFKQLGLSEQLLQSLNDAGYKTPTEIQSSVIPAILDHQDVMAAAQTGTGKTAAFTLPILDILSHGEKASPLCVRALILTPTRELAAQVLDSVRTYGKYLTVSSAAVFGGVKINPQIAHLKKGIDILVATPGRLLDLIGQRAIRLDRLEILVLDEADRMLDMGFIHDIKKVMALLPKKRQTLLFSATFSNEIRQLAKGLMNQILEISATPPNSTVNTVKQVAHPVDKKRKNALLSHLIWENKWEQVLVFTRTKWGANKLADYLVEDGVEATAIHGNKSQGARTRALAAFKQNKVRVLVATDIAARGLDIELLPHVVNFDLPQVSEDYVHRIGRTGRAGATGEAVTLLSADESKQLAEIERLIKQKIERKTIDGFEPDHAVPETSIKTAPTKKQAHSSKKRASSQHKKPFNRDENKSKPKHFSQSKRKNEGEKDNRDKKENGGNRKENRFNTKKTPQKKFSGPKRFSK